MGHRSSLLQKLPDSGGGPPRSSGGKDHACGGLERIRGEHRPVEPHFDYLPITQVAERSLRRGPNPPTVDARRRVDGDARLVRAGLVLWALLDEDDALAREGSQARDGPAD